MPAEETERAALRTQLAQRLEARDHPIRNSGCETSMLEELHLRRLHFMTASGEAVRGFMLLPEDHGRASPAILYIHAHGNRYEIGADELLTGRPALQSPLGPVLARAGFAVVCIDLPCFGERKAASESAAAKAALWQGRSLAGQMIGELVSLLDWMEAQPEIDATRIACFGISMGATLGYWLAAIDNRISALAHLCCFADLDRLVALGAHDLHGIYLTVPGLPLLASNGVIAGLVAPRPQYVAIGDRDPLTPPEAAEPALAELARAYAAAGATGSLQVRRERQGGHSESKAIRTDVLGFFERTLAPSA